MKSKPEVKKLGIQMSMTIYERLSEIADRYGITPNSLITFVIGQYVDSTFDIKDKLSNQLIDSLVKNYGINLESEKSYPEFVKKMSDITKRINGEGEGER